VADQGTDTLSATIYAKFLGTTEERSERPGCKLLATWASNIPALNYGEDDCLYNGNTQISCCTEQPPETKPNPYLQGGSPSDNKKPVFISPSKFDGSIDCLDKTDGGGAATGRRFWTIGQIQVFGELLSNEQIISTADRSKCIASGDSTTDANVVLSQYCVVSCVSGTCFVIADKDSRFGQSTGSSQITGLDLLKFTETAANVCPGDSNKAAIGAGPGITGTVALCVVGQDHPEICTI
jgi:hypothetical protein